MANQNHSPAPVDPKTLEDSKMMWGGFTKGMQMLVIGVAALLLAMALFLLH